MTLCRLIALVLCVAGCAAAPAALDPASQAELHAAAGRLPDAIDAIEVAIEIAPEDAELRLRAGELMAEAGRPKRAIRQLERGLALAPRDARLWVVLGELERERENTSDAYVAFRRAVSLDPRNLRAISGLALTASALGFDEEAESAYARWTELEREQQPASPRTPSPASPPPAR